MDIMSEGYLSVSICIFFFPALVPLTLKATGIATMVHHIIQHDTEGAPKGKWRNHS